MEKNISLFSTLTPSHKRDSSEVSYVRKGGVEIGSRRKSGRKTYTYDGERIMKIESIKGD